MKIPKVSSPKSKKSSVKIVEIKFVPTWLTTALFFVLFGIVIFLFQGRKHGWARFDFILEKIPGFYSHISNFTISYLLYAGIAYFWLMIGVPFRFVILFGVLLLAANFIYELFIPVLNTPDIVDAYFGAVGTLVAFLFLSYVQFFGLKKVG